MLVVNVIIECFFKYLDYNVMRFLVDVVMYGLLQSFRQYKDQQSEVEVFMLVFLVMQDKNIYLENSLSVEIRIKLDLFKALGEVKRQIDLMKGKCF